MNINSFIHFPRIKELSQLFISIDNFLWVHTNAQMQSPPANENNAWYHRNQLYMYSYSNLNHLI